MMRRTSWPLLAEFKLAGWGALLNGFWEFAHSPLYTDHQQGLSYVFWDRLHCTGADVLILLCAYWLTAILFRSHEWWRGKRAMLAATVFTALGCGYTVFSEWLNTEIVGTWAYTEAMPRLGLWGVTPLLQWLVLPPFVVALLHRRA